jgi:hypothetical protein
LQTFSNRRLEVAWDGTIELSAEDAEPLIGAGWLKLGELPEYKLPGYEDGYTEEQNEPPIPKLKYAIGSVESEAEIGKSARGPRGGHRTEGEDAISPRRGISAEQGVSVFLLEDNILTDSTPILWYCFTDLVLPRLPILMGHSAVLPLAGGSQGCSLVS